MIDQVLYAKCSLSMRPITYTSYLSRFGALRWQFLTAYTYYTGKTNCLPSSADIMQKRHEWTALTNKWQSRTSGWESGKFGNRVGWL